MSEYSEKLKDPRWQKLRLSVFERDEWTCQICFDIDVSAIALAMSDSKIMKSLIDNYSEFISNEHSEFIKTGKRKEKNNNG